MIDGIREFFTEKMRWRRILVDVAVVAAVVVAVSAWQSRNLAGEGPAPALEGATLDGARLDLTSLRGAKTVVVFWAPWCGVCKVEMPTLNALANDGVQVVSVASSYQDLASVEGFAREHELAFPVVLGGDRIAGDWSVSAYPTIFVIDESGEIEHALVGYTTGVGLRLRLL